MSHQDDAHLRKNIVAFKAILEGAIPDCVASFVRHGNAVLEPAWLASVAITCWGWTAEGTLTERVTKACTVVGQVFDCEGNGDSTRIDEGTGYVWSAVSRADESVARRPH